MTATDRAARQGRREQPLLEGTRMSTRLFPDDTVYLQRILKASGLYPYRVDGVWGPHTDAGSTLFEARSDALAAEMGTFDARTERNIRTLTLTAQAAARAFMNAMREAGIHARIISGTRSYAEQNALFRQGRYGNPGPRVTNAPGGRSNHNFGIAWDIGIFRNGAYLPESPLYDEAARVALLAGIPGLEWGGNWRSFPDRSHYQIATGLPLAEIRRRFEAGEPYV
ncbi:MAG TPA: M15 family metallopeptidase [Rhodothermales bacterium]|nr:M15 family metallopeptidase [Rhodothermales bacterium]